MVCSFWEGFKYFHDSFFFVSYYSFSTANTDKQTIRLFVDEAIRMSKIHHENVLTPLGITFDAAQIDSEILLHDQKCQPDELDTRKVSIASNISTNSARTIPPVPNEQMMEKKRFFQIFFSHQPSIILPIMVNGDLCRYLRSQKLFPIQSLVNFATQIADGKFSSTIFFYNLFVLSSL